MKKKNHQLDATLDDLKDAIEDSFSFKPEQDVAEISFVSTFLEQHFSKGLQYFLNEAKNNMKEVVNAIATRASLYFGDPNGIYGTAPRYISIYYNLLTRCILTVDGDGLNDIFGLSFLNTILSIADASLSHDRPDVIRQNFTKMFQSIGPRSKLVYQILTERLRALLRQKPSSGQLRLALASLTRMSSNFVSMEKGIKVLFILHEEFSKYQREMCECCATLIMQSIRISPQDYSKIDINVSLATDFIDIIRKKKKDIEPYQYEAIMALSFLQHSNILSGMFDNFYSLIEKELQKKVTTYEEAHEHALQAALYTAIIVAETNGSISYVGLFARFENYIIDFVRANNSAMVDIYKHLRFFAFVDTPVALFITDIGEFMKVMTVITSKNSIVPKALISRVIERCSGFIDTDEKRISINKAVSVIVESISCDTEMEKSMHLLFNSFVNEPKLLESVLLDNHGLANLMWKTAAFDGIESLSEAFLKSIGDQKPDMKHWMIINSTMSCILNNAELFVCLEGEQLRWVMKTLRFILNYFKTLITEKQQTDEISITIFMEQMEGILISFLPTPESNTAFQMLEEFIEFINSKNLTNTNLIPMKNYQEMFSAIKSKGMFDIGNEVIIDQFMSIPKENLSVTTPLTRHLGSIAHILAPDAVGERFYVTKFTMTPRVLREEFTATLILVIAMTREMKNNMLELIVSMLSSGDFVGYNAALLTPAVVHSTCIASLMESLCGWKSRFEGSNPPLCDSNTNFVTNAMRMVQLLLVADKWDCKFISGRDIDVLATCFIMYSDMIPGGQRLCQCAEFLISVFAKYKALMPTQSKLNMAQTLSMWMMRTDQSPASLKAGEIFCDAIATAVDGIAFTDEMFEDMSIILIALEGRLERQPELVMHIMKVYSAMFRSNYKIFSREFFAKMLTGNLGLRACYTKAASASLPSYTTAGSPHYNIIDALYRDDFLVLGEIIRYIPIKNSEGIGLELVGGSVLRGLESQLANFMTIEELMNKNDQSKNKIFRGNGVPERTIVSYTKLFGSDWLVTVIQPIQDLFIDRVNRGMCLCIRQAKLTPEMDLESNRKNFKSLLYEAIDIITCALPRCPIQIIRMLQIVHKNVDDKFPGHGMAIVNGILFLRFIIPAITAQSVSKSKVDDEALQAMMSLSIVMMASVLKGDLTDKGDDFIPFNDVAMLIHNRFDAAVSDLIKEDLTGAAFPTINVDESTICENLIALLKPIFPKLQEVINEISGTRQLKPSENHILSLISQHTQNDEETKPSSIDDFLMSASKSTCEFLSENAPTSTEELDTFFFMDTPASALVDVFYLVASRQPAINEKVIVAHIIQTIAKSRRNFIVVADLSGLTAEAAPRPASIRKFLGMLPQVAFDHFQSLKIIRMERDVAEMLSNADIMLDRILCAQSSLDIPEVQKMSSMMPDECFQALIESGTTHRCVVDGLKSEIHIRPHCVHIMTPVKNLLSVIVIMLREIEAVEPPTEHEGGIAFTIKAKDRTVHVETSAASSLCNLIKAAMNSVGSSAPTAVIDYDPTSAHWALLLAALVNMQVPGLFEPSKELVNAIRDNIKIPLHSDKPIGLMEEAAVHCGAGQAGMFIKEFSKVAEALSEPAEAFSLIRPWSERIAKGAGGPNTLRSMLELRAPTVLSKETIAREVYEVTAAADIRKPLQIIFKVATPELMPALISLSKKHPKDVSEFACEEVSKLNISAIGITTKLVKEELFDYNGFSASLALSCLLAWDECDASMRSLGELLGELIKHIEGVKRSRKIVQGFISKSTKVAIEGLLELGAFGAKVGNMLKDAYGKMSDGNSKKAIYDELIKFL